MSKRIILLLVGAEDGDGVDGQMRRKTIILRNRIFSTQGKKK